MNQSFALRGTPRQQKQTIKKTSPIQKRRMGLKLRFILSPWKPWMAFGYSLNLPLL